ncbi:FG-GAP repeat protein [Luteimonas sp. Sa2BVA3]|uniref:FG-GAP repeat protein n=1 Tax=Luteimonas colneyensis TaxID=2762230 RepID=A0ABR8UKG2_9GAMM|nr:FG-GAP-like repeat-containing protein [Luteimonas colneyensis]MBD7988520.1 FG-GAP repeat protein [Luteimonas colneyensis]
MLLAACAPVPSQTGTDAVDPALAAAAGAPGLPVAIHAGSPDHGSPAAVRGADAIAAFPDRGDLVSYDSVRTPRRNGAHTFYPTRVSEAHALDAIASGTLYLTAPDGGRVALQYERHVEHGSGDWSWIGRDANGVEAILTFGEHAVFGVVPDGQGGSLRLTTNAGQTWVATTDRGMASSLQQRIRAGAVGPDFLVAPELDVDDGVAAASLVSAALDSAPQVGTGDLPVQVAADTTVDVLLGYTPGFVSMLGGTSQALTRLNHIVTVGNQTFANSNVAVTLRLAGTLQVNYPETGSNRTALEQLTGSNGQTEVTIPASLRPLRNARETHGADLVSLVRSLRDPEHNGCGIAWLIGGNQTQITQSQERFGYSVISDSNGMQAPSNGHFCVDETLVHELGHNMGSQHDRESATDTDGVDYGRYPYSFGYKTTPTTGNFHTVMAYGDDGQTAYRIFSNPQSTYCGGRPCGVANQADNARSLRETAPLIAAFRTAGGAGARNDFNGDGRSDLLWRKSNDGRNAIWLAGNSATQQAITSVPGDWEVVGSGDFDGNGVSDIVWRHAVSGRNTIWRGGNGGSTISMATVAKLSWRVVGTGDFNGDGRSDVLWRDGSDGRNAIWLSGNSATQQRIIALPDLGWRVAGVGDFDGNGVDDIVWRHAGSGRNVVWRGGNGNSSYSLTTVPSASWWVAGVGDFNGDGRADVFWRHSTTGRNALWLAGNSATQQSVPTVALSWRVEGTGDFNGDGSADLVWRKNTGDNNIWRSANANSTSWLAKVPDQAWDIVP